MISKFWSSYLVGLKYLPWSNFLKFFFLFCNFIFRLLWYFRNIASEIEIPKTHLTLECVIWSNHREHLGSTTYSFFLEPQFSFSNLTVEGSHLIELPKARIQSKLENLATLIVATNKFNPMNQLILTNIFARIDWLFDIRDGFVGKSSNPTSAKTTNGTLAVYGVVTLVRLLNVSLL